MALWRAITKLQKIKIRIKNDQKGVFSAAMLIFSDVYLTIHCINKEFTGILIFFSFFLFLLVTTSKTKKKLLI